MKRFLDIIISLSAIVVLIPIFLIVTLLSSLESGFPVLYAQTRVGINGQLFKLIKFRSMIVGGDSQGYMTKENDNRITKIGKVLRKTSLDELPQLFNILFGDMSLVGPRPKVPAQEATYQKEAWDEILSVKPGLTGLAQVNGRSALTQEKLVELERRYVKNASLRLDIKIILKTFKVVFFKINQSN